jgi:hypothetical protein
VEGERWWWWEVEEVVEEEEAWRRRRVEAWVLPEPGRPAQTTCASKVRSASKGEGEKEEGEVEVFDV